MQEVLGNRLSDGHVGRRFLPLIAVEPQGTGCRGAVFGGHSPGPPSFKLLGRRQDGLPVRALCNACERRREQRRHTSEDPLPREWGQ